MNAARRSLLVVASRVPWRRVAAVALAAAPAAVLLGGAIDRRWMNEDAFINLRVIRNWLHGYGFVFNLDERVEATTSPLWAAMIALLGAIGVRLEYAAALFAIVLTVGGLALGQAGAARLHRSLAGTPLRVVLPVGAAIVAVLPPVWDYASSGLETGLCLAWLGAAFLVLARFARPAGGVEPLWRLAVYGALLGLGPLARPEFALYAAPFVLLLAGGAAAVRLRHGQRVAGAAIAIAVTFASAAVLPIGYEIFRMGYFAAVVPNTAIAKEAFASNLKQGECYFNNFFGTYRMAWPLGAAAFFTIARLVCHVRERRALATATMLAPVLAGAAHVAYLVEIGGDYMHGRLLVPPVFAMLLPVMAIPVPRPRSIVRWAMVASAGACLLVWLPMCLFTFRVGVENVCEIGDERGWYSRKADEPNPVTLDGYRRHPFYDDAMKAAQHITGDCPGQHASLGGDAPLGCRRVYIETDKAGIWPAPPSSPLARDIDPRVSAVVTAGAIGIVGYALPPPVHVMDHHGLSDPIIGHFELTERGRPGHEKKLSDAWMLARFAEPKADEDSAVTAARHALHCRALGALVRATSAPLTTSLFFDNVAHALEYTRLRIPRDPYEAEARFCGTPIGHEARAGGNGGAAFRWLCPTGKPLVGLRGSYKPGEKAIARVQALCGEPGAAANSGGEGLGGEGLGGEGLGGGAEGASLIEGPWFGETADSSFEVTCPSDTRVVGLYGTSDDLIRTVGLSCRPISPGGSPGTSDASLAAEVRRTSTGGVNGGRPFAVLCPAGTSVVGIIGHSGALVDSVGISCSVGALPSAKPAAP